MCPIGIGILNNSNSPLTTLNTLLFKFGSIREERTVREAQSQSWIKSMVGILPSISMLWLIVVLRTVTTNSFLGFIPILMKTRDLSDWMGGMALSGYMIGGGIGGILGGYLGAQIFQFGFEIFNNFYRWSGGGTNWLS